MAILNNKIKIHIKNNRWKEGSFPNTAEGEKVFSITDEHLKNSLISYPELEKSVGMNEIMQDIHNEKIMKSVKKNKDSKHFQEKK